MYQAHSEKTCTVCGTAFPATTEYFFKEKRGKYGLRSKCKTCFTAAAKLLKATPAYREKAKEHGRKYYTANKERFAERWQRYYQENADHLREQSREWGRNNLEKRREMDSARRESPQYRLHTNMSRAIRQSLFRFNGKNGAPWEMLVGYTKQDLVAHLENQFIDGMSWENYGEWHIDHIIPQVAFSFESHKDEDFKKCWSLANLQPLWAQDNMSKGARTQ